MADDLNHYGFTFDAAMQLQDTNGGNAITAQQFGQVAGAAVLIDVGDAVFYGCMVVDVSALTDSNSNNDYEFILQGATRGTGSTPDLPVLGSTVENLGEIEIGNSGARRGSGCTVTSVAGRYFLFFHNVAPDGTHYPILRVCIVPAGTSKSITLSGGGVWIGKIGF